MVIHQCLLQRPRCPRNMQSKKDTNTVSIEFHCKSLALTGPIGLNEYVLSVDLTSEYMYTPVLK